MSKRLKMQTLIIIFLFVFCNINLVYANGILNQKKTQYLPIPNKAYPICSVNNQLIYSIITSDFGDEFYKYNPQTQKSEFLGKIDDTGVDSGDSLVLNNRYLFACYPVDKRGTKDPNVLRREDETVRIVCVDLKEKKTYEICRFFSQQALVYIEPINDYKFLVYGHVEKDSDTIKSYIDTYNLKTGKWSTLITVEDQDIGAVTYDNGHIYTITIDWGAKWPDWDQHKKPIYTFNSYNEAGELLEQKPLDFDQLFPPEEGALDRLYTSFIQMDVSGDYVKLNDFGPNSALFRFNGNETEVLYSGRRLNCWNSNGGFKENKVYLGTLNGNNYLLLKDQNRLLPQQNNKIENVDTNITYWDGESDHVYKMLSDENGDWKFVYVPIEKF